jgi:hypothetical protein
VKLLSFIVLNWIVEIYEMFSRPDIDSGGVDSGYQPFEWTTVELELEFEFGVCACVCVCGDGFFACECE